MINQLYTEQPIVTPTMALPGHYQVGVKTFTIDGPNLLRSKEGRSLTLEAWYPTQDQKEDYVVYQDVTRSHKSFHMQGKAIRDAKPITQISDEPTGFPLVVLSHGYTGYRTIMFYLGEHLASRGYVVISIDHTDSTNRDVDFNTNPGSGFLSTLLHRARDQQAVLDYVVNSEESFLGADSDNAAVIGFSMGGFGALNTVGGCYAFSNELATAFGVDATENQELLQKLNSCFAGKTKPDPRWKASVLIAPWGGEQSVFGSLEGINAPALFIAGKDDDVSGYENGVKKLFEQSGASNKYMLVYQNARHNVAPHPAPKEAFESELDLGHYFEPAWSSEVINRINKHMISAFLDCHIKNDKAACGLLPKTQRSTQQKQADGKLSPAWPGFPDRFATGLEFYWKN